MIKNIIKLIRVKQWVKNAFVLAPLLFSLKFMELDSIIKAGLAFISFCCVSSFIYINNDIIDRKKDKLHPKKKTRPIASGKITPIMAELIALFLLGISVVCMFFLNSEKTVYTLFLYVIINIIYSLKLKQVVIIDVIIIACGFILRVYAGAYAINVPVSSYIFMTTLFISLFLGFSKRKGELIKNGKNARDVLAQYNTEILNSYIIISMALTIICYALYTLEPSTIERFQTNRLIYSIIFVIYGMFRYTYILENDKNSEDPTENLVKDKALMVICGLYVLYIVVIFMKII